MSQDQHDDEGQWTEIGEDAPQEPNVSEAWEGSDDGKDVAPGQENASGAGDGTEQRQSSADGESPEPHLEDTQDTTEYPKESLLVEAFDTHEDQAHTPEETHEEEGPESAPQHSDPPPHYLDDNESQVVPQQASEQDTHQIDCMEEASQDAYEEEASQEYLENDNQYDAPQHAYEEVPPQVDMYASKEAEGKVVPQQAYEEEASQEYLENDNQYDAPQHAYEEVPPRYAHARSMPEPHAAAAPLSAIVKPRTRNVKHVARWEPVEYDPRDGSDDEFEQSTCMAPIYEGEESNEGASVFKHGEPDCTGEIMSCFDEPNLLYRIIDPKAKTWAFYNDSLHYEMHVQFTFGKHSKLSPLENTTMRQNEEGQYVMEVVVYPTETEMFVQGSVNGFTSKLRALPLTDDYHNARRGITEEQVNNEVAAIQQVTYSDNAEDVLQVCIENGIPFVDPEYPPCQASLDAGASKPFKPLAWARPQACVPEEMASQVRLFRANVRPGCVDAGDLGDSWVICSVASVSEDPARLLGMFRHPEGKASAQREHAVGAYRVTFNKNGWWRSVLVDSYLPVSGGKLKYAKSATDSAEIWPAILQKAYAKLHGSYAKICSGDPLHALQDMTGFPTMRFDDLLTDGRTGNQLFSDLVHGIAAGYTVICSTPGYGPNGKDQGLCDAYAQVGLVTGHAYTILEAKYIESKDLRLVKVRNAWGRGVEWNGSWSNDDTRWDANPDLAEECNFQKADGTFWMSWKDAQKYFNGGGVCFSHQPAYDYRMNCVFTDGVPSAVLEIDVQSPAWFTFVVSQDDKRCQVNPSEYKPVMISVAEPVEGDMYKVVLNSSGNGAQPSSDKWTFLQARDISLIHKLDAGKYIVVPRIMPSDDPVEPVPYVLGMICNKEVGNGDVSVKFKRLDAGNRVFENFPKFEPELMEVEQPVQYQKRAPGEGFPMTQMGEELA
ncbi:hypothetical protein JIQ42_05742 [Leishmania sp. Namibia]|uniref:hypothetical protein n=1 Tax=Leishmania sp. Namibia TaxID=2802991 RepID=UPI001B60C49F|nr:hypothetical protein JIQ42_05742 [Leishmania sp. Namibia]